MSKEWTLKSTIAILVLFFWTLSVFAQAPTVLSTSPAQNELNVIVSTNISVTFDIDMDSTTINNSAFVVNAWSTGLHLGTISYNAATKIATLDPYSDFVVGEIVTVVLTSGIKSSAGTPMESSYVWSFTTRVNDGAGCFTPPFNYDVGNYPGSVFCADLDGDSDLDLAVANLGSENVSILKNDGYGTFDLDSNYAAGPSPYSVFCADLDRDGDLDLAVANDNSWQVSILKNNGDGTFQLPEGFYLGLECPYSVFCADLDRDGDLDLAVANVGSVPPYSGSVSILKNNGNGTFQDTASYGMGEFVSVFCADLYGDGDLDLAAVHGYGNNVSIFRNNGDGTFQSAVNYGTGLTPWSVFCADLDGDGDLDLAVANQYSSNVSILKNNGDGSFQTKLDYGAGDSPWSLFCADLDGDGDLDLAVANYGSHNVSILLNCLPTGDCNGDEVVDIGDIMFLINYLFTGTSAPDPLGIGDVNCSGEVDIGDVMYLINYLFAGTSAPGCC